MESFLTKENISPKFNEKRQVIATEFNGQRVGQFTSK